jgi:transposase InsO family protein
LHFKIVDKIVSLGFFMGGDRFFKLLSDNDLLVESRRRTIATKISRHPSRVYDNLIVDKEFTAPNQAWAVDISYLRLENEFRYLALVKDLYSHKIIGYDISDSLGAEGSLRALKMALKEGRVPHLSIGFLTPAQMHKAA